MKLLSEIHSRRILHRLVLLLFLGGVSAFLNACTGSGVQVTKSGWEAQRYLLFDEVWASTDLGTPTDLHRLNNSWEELALNGYLTTKTNGQGKMRQGNSCTVYVFKSSGFLASSKETISTCPRGSTGAGCTDASTALLSNCGASVVTLPATISFIGTQVIVIEYRRLESVAIIVAEGTAVVDPVDEVQPTFEVTAQRAAYAVTPDFQPQAEQFFGFPPGVEIDWVEMVQPIQDMDQVDQIQSANSILRGQDEPLVPLPQPFQVGMRWINEVTDDIRLSQAIAFMVDWNQASANLLPPEIPLVFVSQGEQIDLRVTQLDPDQGFQLMEEAGFATDELVMLAYDQSIPELAGLAEQMQAWLLEMGGITVELIAVDPQQAAEILENLREPGMHAIFLGGS